MTDNVVLEHLRAIRADNAEVKATLREHGSRLTSIDLGLASLHGDYAGQSLRIDRLSDRVERIEVRLGLTDA